MITTTSDNRVYVACLACYNEGTLSGVWMNHEELDIAWDHNWEEDSTGERILCKHKHHEEWAIHDYDGDIHRLGLGEHPDIHELIKIMELIDDTDPSVIVPAFLLCQHIKGDFGIHFKADDVDMMTVDMYCIDDVGEWASEFFEGCYSWWDELPSIIVSAINWDDVGQDLLHDYYHIEYGHYIYATHAY